MKGTNTSIGEVKDGGGYSSSSAFGTKNNSNGSVDQYVEISSEESSSTFSPESSDDEVVAGLPGRSGALAAGTTQVRSEVAKGEVNARDFFVDALS